MSIPEHWKVKESWKDAPLRTMLVLGESTVAGGSATKREYCWVSRLTDLLNSFQSQPVRMINSGIGANVISTRSPQYPVSGRPAALERYRRHVVEHQPDLVLISYGLNDNRGGTLLPQFLEDLEELIDRIRSETGALLGLLGHYFMTGFDRYGPHWNRGSLANARLCSDAMRVLAQRKGTLFIDVLRAQDQTRWLVDDDGVHANNVGHQLIACEVFKVLVQHCACLGIRSHEEAESYPRWRDESVLRENY